MLESRGKPPPVAREEHVHEDLARPSAIRPDAGDVVLPAGWEVRALAVVETDDRAGAAPVPVGADVDVAVRASLIASWR